MTKRKTAKLSIAVDNTLGAKRYPSNLPKNVFASLEKVLRPDYGFLKLRGEHAKGKDAKEKYCNCKAPAASRLKENGEWLKEAFVSGAEADKLAAKGHLIGWVPYRCKHPFFLIDLDVKKKDKNKGLVAVVEDILGEGILSPSSPVKKHYGHLIYKQIGGDPIKDAAQVSVPGWSSIGQTRSDNNAVIWDPVKFLHLMQSVGYHENPVGQVGRDKITAFLSGKKPKEIAPTTTGGRKKKEKLLMSLADKHDWPPEGRAMFAYKLIFRAALIDSEKAKNHIAEIWKEHNESRKNPDKFVDDAWQAGLDKRKKLLAQGENPDADTMIFDSEALADHLEEMDIEFRSDQKLNMEGDGEQQIKGQLTEDWHLSDWTPVNEGMFSIIEERIAESLGVPGSVRNYKRSWNSAFARNRVFPTREWLENIQSIKPGDSPLVEDVFHGPFDLLNNEHEKLFRWWSRHLMERFVYVATHPKGVIYDAMGMILMGDSHIAKSGFACTLFPDFLRHDLYAQGFQFNERDDKANCEIIGGKLLAEIADKAGLEKIARNSSAADKFNAFLTRTHDVFRPAYGRHIVNQRRTATMMVTTNDPFVPNNEQSKRRLVSMIVGEKEKYRPYEFWNEEKLVKLWGEAKYLVEKHGLPPKPSWVHEAVLASSTGSVELTETQREMIAFFMREAKKQRDDRSHNSDFLTGKDFKQFTVKDLAEGMIGDTDCSFKDRYGDRVSPDFTYAYREIGFQEQNNNNNRKLWVVRKQPWMDKLKLKSLTIHTQRRYK